MASFRTCILRATMFLAILAIGTTTSDLPDDQLEFATPPAFDLLEYSTSFASGQLMVTLTFDPSNAADLDTLVAWVDFDTDQNPNTGGGSSLEAFQIEPYPLIGVDYYIELFFEDAILYQISEGIAYEVAACPVTVDGATMIISVPRCHETPCVGIATLANFDSVILLGNGDGPTDRLPDDSSVISAAPEPGDLDEDGDVDSADCTLLGSCITGSNNGPVTGPCTRADLDADTDVDQVDLGLLQRLLTGSW